MQKKILICGFKGATNTSKLLLDILPIKNKLYLENDFIISVEQLIEILDNNSFDLIIIFGQKPNSKSLYIETTGINQESILTTTYNVVRMEKYFKDLKYKVKISNNAGKYLCNNIYYHCIKYLVDNGEKTEAIFLHIPNKNNIFDLQTFANNLIRYIG